MQTDSLIHDLYMRRLMSGEASATMHGQSYGRSVAGGFGTVDWQIFNMMKDKLLKKGKGLSGGMVYRPLGATRSVYSYAPMGGAGAYQDFVKEITAKRPDFEFSKKQLKDLWNDEKARNAKLEEARNAKLEEARNDKLAKVVKPKKEKIVKPKKIGKKSMNKGLADYLDFYRKMKKLHPNYTRGKINCLWKGETDKDEDLCYKNYIDKQPKAKLTVKQREYLNFMKTYKKRYPKLSRKDLNCLYQSIVNGESKNKKQAKYCSELKYMNM